MLRPMLERVFLGWDQPFVCKLVPWLLARREVLPQCVIVVPTAQAGRRLRESLAEAAGALLAPRVVTPGLLLQLDQPEIAEDWLEKVAWIEELENTTDWATFEALLPHPPEVGGSWARALATEMVSLRRSLHENGLTLSSAAQRLRQTIEAERWQAMSTLESRVEFRLNHWGFRSRSSSLARGIRLPANPFILATADFPPLLERALSSHHASVTALIAAPESEAEHFSELGRPLENWTQRPIPWIGPVTVVADPRQQASEAWETVASAGTRSDDVALGAADPEVGDELARTFSRNGWPAFHPAAAKVSGGLARWLASWGKWLAEPSLDVFAELLGLPETSVLIQGGRAQKAKRLAELRDQWMILHTEDLERRFRSEEFRSEGAKRSAGELLEAARALERWRTELLRGPFPAIMGEMMAKLGKAGPQAADSCDFLNEWLTNALPIIETLQRDARFWIEQMISAIPSPATTPPSGRVIDVQGWLELLFEPGSHLILCGMNEGKVPGRAGGEPWLSENSRTILGLTSDLQRAARDGFLLRTILESRRTDGTVDIFCGKSGTSGETLLPSRLLLLADRDELPQRVKALFREVEPPDAGLRWHADWRWKTRTLPPPQRLSVTSLGDYLACPFRYYLKHVLRMNLPDAARSEWSARDFGTVAHEVLERWGSDSEARDLSKTEALEAWFSAELDSVVAEWFGKRPPLAVRLQTMALRQRFTWLARVQACERASGWEVIDVERKVEIPVGSASLIAKIDRIDRNRHDGRLRVIDYKTGRIDGVERNHRKKITASTRIPPHLDPDGPAVHHDSQGKKQLWFNLQLPLYAAAVLEREGILPTPCYFGLRSTQQDVQLHEWDCFSDHDLSAARACAEAVAAKIGQGVFWPPSERVTYDDYRILASGKTLAEAVIPPILETLTES